MVRETGRAICLSCVATRRGLAFLLFGLLAASSLAQRAPNWRAFKLADGMPESACIAVTLTSQGKVLARHLTRPLVSELDGYSIISRFTPEVGKGRIYQSPSGQFWTAVPEGLLEFRNGSWLFHRVPEIAAETSAAAAHVVDPVPLLPVRQGLLLFLLPSGLMQFNSQDPDHPRISLLCSAASAGVGNFWGMTQARDGGLWISGSRGVARFAGPVRNLMPKSVWEEHLLTAAMPLAGLQSLHDDLQGGVIALAQCSTNRQQYICSFDGQDWAFQDVRPERVRQVWRSADKLTWAMTIESLFQVNEPGGVLHENEDVSARQYFDVAVEPSGAFWLATSDGLFRYAPLLWRSPPGVRRFIGPVHCLTGDQEGRLWFAAENEVFGFQNGELTSFPLPSTASGHLQPRALFVAKDGTVVLDSQEPETGSGDELLMMRPEGKAFTALPGVRPGTKLKVLGAMKDGALCLENLGETRGPVCPLERFDGQRLESFPTPPPVASAGTNLSCLFATQNGDLWLGGDLCTAWYHENSWRFFSAADKAAPGSPAGFIEFPDGRLWTGSQDQLWEFDGRSWSVVRRGFDHINGLARSSDGSIWVASNNGIYRYFQGAWVENGLDEGLPSMAVRELFEDRNGALWAATARGVVLFHPEADTDPPRTRIEELSDYGNNVPAGGTITFAFHGQDKWKYTPRERLLYSWRLDEHDWSPFEETSQKSFSDLAAGKHVLQVRAMDRNCNIESKSSREFAVILPWYRETRLVFISGAGLLLALFFAGLAFNRHRQLLLSYADIERKVAERTHQLEITSRELLQSQKMNALGTLAAGIAHDFNNILSIIKGSAQIIEDNLDNPEKIRTRADRIRTVVEQGAGIVKAMLGFSRESSGQPAPCDLNAVVEDTLKLLGDRFLREVQVSFQPTLGLPEVVASKDFIQQILLNFIFNAAESMESNKQINLATAMLTALPPDLVLAPAAATQYVAVSVQDFGCGITPQTLPRIFEPFFTTKALSTRRGTGLGLSMVYELAKRLEAGLAVETTVGRGSTFFLILAVGKASNETAT